MTSTAGSYDDGRSPQHRIALWLGHYYSQITLILLAVVAAIMLTRIWAGRPTAMPYNILNAAAAYTAVLTLIVAMWGNHVHTKNMCMRDFNAAPLADPQGQVERHMSRLRLIHLKAAQITMIGAAVIIVAVQLVLSALPSSLPVAAKLAATLLLVPAFATIIYLSIARMTHQRLQLWCPWCRRHRGDDHTTPAPTPDPVGHNSSN